MLECTPKSVIQRLPHKGLCACANHFCTKELRSFTLSRRYNLLMQAATLPTVGLADMTRKLHEVNQGPLTLQTMVFEPTTLRLHLAIGSTSTTAQPLKALDLGPRFVPRVEGGKRSTKPPG